MLQRLLHHPRPLLFTLLAPLLLASLTHCFDGWVLGIDPRLHHLHSLLWFAAGGGF